MLARCRAEKSKTPSLALGGFLAAGLGGTARNPDRGEPVLVAPDALSEAERPGAGVASGRLIGRVDERREGPRD
jgi:hypothetical protein